MNKAPSQRQLRVGETIRHALSEVLSRGEVRAPELEGKVVTVTEVTLSPDLKLATAYVMPLGGEKVTETIEALNKARKFLRGRIGRALTTKFTPDLRFAADSSFEYSTRMDRLFTSPDFYRAQDEPPADDKG